MDANPNAPAFPPMHDPRSHEFGLTKRELIAALAMQGFLSNPHVAEKYKGHIHVDVVSMIALRAVEYTDALLAELSKPTLTPAQLAEGDYTSRMGS